MKVLNYKIDIDAPREKVWDLMIDKKVYSKWAKAFSPKSQFDGVWKQGEKMKFFDPDMGGTLALIEVFDKPNRSMGRHIAMLNKDGSQDVSSEMAKKWIGTIEDYKFMSMGSKTRLFVEIKTHEDFAKMFDESWPKALELLKEVCES